MSVAWTSLHVFVHDFSRLTHFIQHCLATLPPSLRDNCFFVRYWLGGPHLRVRLRNPADLPLLQAAVQDYWTEHRFESALEPETFYRSYASELATETERYWHCNGSAHLIAYRPETQRYGGAAGLPLCEDEFVSDSRTMLVMLQQHTAAQLEHILFGYCLVHAQVLTVHGLRRAALLYLCGSAEVGQVRQYIMARSGGKVLALRAALQARQDSLLRGDYWPQYLIPLQARLDTLVTQLAAHGCADLVAVCSSLLHMSFNRAGITPAKESHIRLFALHLLNEAYP